MSEERYPGEQIQFAQESEAANVEKIFKHDIESTLNILQLKREDLFAIIHKKEMDIINLLEIYTKNKTAKPGILFTIIKASVTKASNASKTLFSLLQSNEKMNDWFRSFQFNVRNQYLREGEKWAFYSLMSITYQEQEILEAIDKVITEALSNQEIKSWDYLEEGDMFFDFGKITASEIVKILLAKLESWHNAEKFLMREWEKGVAKGTKQLIASNGIPVEILDGVYTQHGSFNILGIGGMTTIQELNATGMRYRFQSEHYVATSMPIGKKATLIYRELGKENLLEEFENVIKSPHAGQADRELAEMLKKEFHEEKVAYIDQVEVLPAYKSQGLAPALLDIAAWEIEKQKKLKWTFARVLERNPDSLKMESLFKKAGYMILRSSIETFDLRYYETKQYTLAVKQA